MKKLRKKSYPKQADAQAVLAAKYGIKPSNLKLKKEHKIMWMFDIVPAQEESNQQSFTEKAEAYRAVLAQYREENPDVPYSEAQKAAAEIFKAQA